MAGEWEGAAQATQNVMGMGLKLYEMQGTRQHQATMERLAVEEGQRKQQAFQHAEQKRIEQDAMDNARTPLSLVAPGLKDNPKLLELYVETARSAGHKIEQSPDGEYFPQNKAIKYIAELHKTNHEFNNMATTRLKDDLLNQSIAVSQEIAKLQESGKTDQKALQPLQQKQAAILKQRAEIITASEKVQEEIAIANAKKEAITPPHGVTEITAPDGKSAQKMQYNAKTNRYDIPVGDPYAVKSQVININTGASSSDAFNTWSPEEKEQAFGYNMITGKPPENARGMRANDRQAYAKGYAKWQLEKGYKPSDVALMQADYRGGNMSLSNMAKQEAPMAAFVGNINKQIDRVKQIYDNNDRTGIRLIDLPVREIKMRAKGSGDEAVKASYLLEISNEIGKLSSGASASVQQLSDSAKEDWKKVHDPNLSFREIMKVVNATRDQANMRLSTWKEAKEAVRGQLRSLGVPDTQTKATHQYIPGKGIVEIR
jgi:hypothetical protein